MIYTESPQMSEVSINDTSSQRRRCVLHIGIEKSGTTSLQNYLAANRKELWEQGFSYPDYLGAPTQRLLVTYAMNDDRPDSWRTKRGIDAPEGLSTHRQEIEGKIRKEQATTLLLSSEHCHSRLIHKEEVQRLGALLSAACDEFVVVVYLRPQHEVSISLYSTQLRSGHPRPSLIPDKPSRYYDYAALLDLWTEVFGKESMRVRIYSRDMISDYLGLVGVDSTRFRPAASTNTALSGEAQAFLARVNPYLRDRSIVRLVESFGEKPSALPNREDAERFYERFAESNERVRCEWFPERPSLFDMDFSRYLERSQHHELSEDEWCQIFAHAWNARKS